MKSQTSLSSSSSSSSSSSRERSRERTRRDKPQRRALLSDLKKTKKKEKKTNNFISCSFSLVDARARFSFSLFLRDVSNSVPLHRNFSVSSLSFRSRNNKLMQSIQSTVVVEVRILSLSLSLSPLSSQSVSFRLSLPFSLSCFLLPLESRAPVTMIFVITFLDIFLDRLPAGKRFVSLLTL